MIYLCVKSEFNLPFLVLLGSLLGYKTLMTETKIFHLFLEFAIPA